MTADENQAGPRKAVPHHGHVLGNGGQAVRVGSELFPRDLHEVGLARAAHIGADHSDRVCDRLSSFQLPIELPFSTTLLACKLTDIQRLSPKLGEFILATLTSYEWIPVEQPLAPTEDASNKAGEPPLDFVQVANRLRERIYIHRPSWLELSDISRVAILVHEAVYALLIPTATGESETYKQIGARARAITGLLFDASVTKETPQLRTLLTHLGLPETGSTTDTTSGVPYTPTDFGFRVDFVAYRASAAFEQLAVKIRAC